MKTLRISFNHPVQGKASLIQMSPIFHPGSYFKISSKEGNLIEIPVLRCEEGKWKAVLNWEHDDQTFTYQREFEYEKIN